MFFVDFGALRDARLVSGSIASALGLTVGAEDPLPGLLTFLRGRRILLIFDSCEHILDALAPLAERLVRELPELHILATSREILSRRRRARLPAVSAGLPAAARRIEHCGSPCLSRGSALHRTHRRKPERIPAQRRRGSLDCRNLPATGRHPAGDRARGRACQRLWHRRHRLSSQHPLLAAVARAADGHSEASDARRGARLELRPAVAGRERDFAQTVGVRRAVRAGSGACGRLSRRPHRARQLSK